MPEAPTALGVRPSDPADAPVAAGELSLEQLQELVAPGVDVLVVGSAVNDLKVRLGASEYTVKMRERAQAILAMAQAGKGRHEIAKALNIKPNSVRVALWRLRSAKLLNDLRDRCENDLTALAVDSAAYHLRKKDKDVTIKHLEGVGFYKNHSHAKHEGGGPGFSMPPLQVNVVFGAGAQPLPGQAPDFSEAVVGVPRRDA